MLLSMLLTLPFTLLAQLPLDSVGWTIVTPHENSRIMYVSNTDGNDTTAQIYGASDFDNPFLPGSNVLPFQDIETAKSHMRDGMGDWILFKKGDTFYDVIGSNKVSGLSPEYPTLYGSYGSSAQRPAFLSGERTVFRCIGGGGTPEVVNNYAVIGIDMYLHEKDPSNPAYTGAPTSGLSAILIGRSGENILIEDCRVRFAQLTLQQFGGNGDPIENLKVRRCVVTDNYSSEGHAQGTFCSGINNLLIEENVFDHNGWHETVPGANQTVFNHNMYIQYTNGTGLTTIRNNIIARASSHGVQLRSGGLLENNLFVRDPLPFFIGVNKNQTDNIVQLKYGTAINNVCLEANDIGTAPRGYAMELMNLESALATNNLFTTDMSSDYNSQPIFFSQDVVRNAVVEHNTIYNWGDETPGGSTIVSTVDLAENNYIGKNIIQQQDLQTILMNIDTPANLDNYTFEDNRYFTLRPENQKFFVDGTRHDFASWQTLTADNSLEEEVVFDDPDRNLATYQASLGATPSFEAFMAEARLQSKDNWRSEYTAQAVNDYLRNGFCSSYATPQANFNHTINTNAIDFEDASVVDNIGLQYDITSWEWDFGDDSPVSFEKNPSHSYSANGIYNVTLTVGNACRSNTISTSINYTGLNTDEFLLEENNNDLQIFPNPASNSFNISGMIGSYTIQILDVLGKQLQTFSNAEQNMKIDISNVTTGLYFVKFVNNGNNHQFTKKIIVK